MISSPIASSSTNTPMRVSLSPTRVRTPQQSNSVSAPLASLPFRRRNKRRLPSLQSLILSLLTALLLVIFALELLRADWLAPSIRVSTHPSVKVTLVASGVAGVRSLVVEQNGRFVLAAATGLRRIVRLSLRRATFGERTPLLDWTGLQLNHALLIAEYRNNTILLASSKDTVYVWENYSIDSVLDVDDAHVLVHDINRSNNGKYGHETRSLAFDENNGHLYVSIGSVSNVDSNSLAARIVRFKIFDDEGNLIVPNKRDDYSDSEGDFRSMSRSEGQEGFDFVEDGELWADGIRNSVAMAFDSYGRLWESNNGPDELSRNDLRTPDNLAPDSEMLLSNYNDESESNNFLTVPSSQLAGIPPDFHNDSPVEEINLLDEQGMFYGYPYCFTAGNMTSSFERDVTRGTQWAWVNGGIDGVRDDQWCRNKSNNKPPAAHIPAHSAPISMVFLKQTDGCGKIDNVSFPCSFVGNLVVTLHGSWNRNIPQGYSVIMIPFENGMPKPSSDNSQPNTIVTLLEASKMTTRCLGVNKMRCFRPSGIAVRSDRGSLLVASDTTGEIVEITFNSHFSL